MKSLAVMKRFVFALFGLAAFALGAQAQLQLTRTPRPLPKMKINPDVKDLFSFKYEDFELVDYDPWPHIKAEVSV